MTAATALNVHLWEQQQQQPEWQCQVQQQYVATLAAALLLLWHCLALLLSTCWLPAIVPTIGPSTELALLVLTGPQGGLAPDTDIPVLDIARQRATTTVRLVAGCTRFWAERVSTDAGTQDRAAAVEEEAVFVSDTVQQAIILHLAALVYACRQQQQQRQQAANDGSSSSSWAPAEAKRVLRQLGLPLDLVQHYASLERKAVPGVDEPILDDMIGALANLQAAIDARARSLAQPDGVWAVRSARSMAAAAEAQAAAEAANEATKAAAADGAAAADEAAAAAVAIQTAIARAAAAAPAAAAAAQAGAGAGAAGGAAAADADAPVAADAAVQTFLAAVSDIIEGKAEFAAAAERAKAAIAATAESLENAEAAVDHLAYTADANIHVAQTCPGFTLSQLVYLVLESISVLGFKQDRLKAAVGALSFMARLLAYARAQATTDRVAPEASRVHSYAEGCVGYIWLGLGKQLQQASGVAEAELEGYSHQLATAAAAGGSPTSRSQRPEVMQTSNSGSVQTPADAAARLQVLLSMHGRCLFGAISLYQGE
jgi:hypothetical protein